jgi:hypothetical protein
MRIQECPVQILILLWLTACGVDDGESSSFAAHDSAGVRVANNDRPQWRTDGGWSVDSIPAFSIGAADGDASHTFYRVSSIIPVSRDTIVVVNGGPTEIRWYDSGGQLLSSVGGTGEGPGEFSRYGPGHACLTTRGQLLVADPMQQRANVFRMDGESVTVIRLSGDAAFPSIQGCFDDGSLLGWRAISPSERVPGTTISSEFVWSRIDSTGTRLTELVRVPGTRQYLLDNGDGTASYHTIPFTVRPSAVASGSSIYFTSGDAPVVERRGLDGNLEAVIRWSPSRMSTSELYGRYRTHLLEGLNPERRAGLVRFFGQGISIPDSVPVTQGMLVDDAKNLWLETYRLPWDSIPEWDVISEEGRWLGTLPLSPRFRPMHITHDAVYGVHRDSLDVERIHAYRIIRR